MFAFDFTLTYDKISLLFALNVAILGLAGIIASLKYMDIYDFKPKIPYYPTLIVFIVSMLLIPGVRDWFTFLFLWEIMTLSSYLLIVYDYPEEKAKNAAWKYFVTMHLFDTSPLILAIVIYYAVTGTFNFVSFADYRDVIVLLMFIGFAAKAGLFPLHFWLPDAHPAAPSPVSALMSGAMVELGLYGSIRILQAVNWSVSPWIVNLILVMAVLSMLAAIFSYGIQDDVKSLFAWSTIDNMGWLYLLVVAGLLGASGVEKGISYYVLAHGLAKGAAFMTTGALLYVFGTRSLSKMKGMINADQLTAGLMIASIFALEGVPPFNFFLNKLNVIKTLLTVNTTLAYFVAIEWVIAFILFLRVIHKYILVPDEHPRAMRKTALNIAFSVILLLVLSLVSQFIANYIWVRW
ncbi:complex I subunit 5 family protein [Thermococcus barophilus]|uniref:Membrane bound subgroup 4b [NiFe]-hydrogenase MBH(B)3, subunit Mbh(B)3H n=1 Tax=Thermococcus barophilus TaxID=55802 RepID=A0A0S1XD18_THEBA|nr:complex I subunit 5 family protein [Thermococcus barophilus]ALM75674.1 Membrane bound subgroup 4b [NiFe]-hydrogenase MBH(b)3, subunit Mbh(b)3H' [Thermococcus barophilus]